MKKLMLVMLLGGFLFTSCQKDDLSSQTELEAVEGRGNNKLKIDNPDDESSCQVNLLPDLPTTLNACVSEKGIEAIDSYFNLKILDTFLAGDYDAWCGDLDTSLDKSDCIEASVYSSLDSNGEPNSAIPSGEFENPQNFDLVNFLLNENEQGKIIGAPSTRVPGTAFTFGDLQAAIWYLLDDNLISMAAQADLGDYNDDRARELQRYALDNGEGYKPGAGNVLVVVLIPNDASKQNVLITIPLECEEEPSCETAFAYDDIDATCFDAYEFERWGWTIGPISEGSYTYDVYAGAGQCDLSKGTLVGTVDVSYNAGNLQVNYNLDGGYTINEEHTYAGSAPIPTGEDGSLTVAPGQYAEASDNPLSGDIYVILHTEVCGEFED